MTYKGHVTLFAVAIFGTLFLKSELKEIHESNTKTEFSSAYIHQVPHPDQTIFNVNVHDPPIPLRSGDKMTFIFPNEDHQQQQSYQQGQERSKAGFGGNKDKESVQNNTFVSAQSVDDDDSSESFYHNGQASYNFRTIQRPNHAVLGDENYDAHDSTGAYKFPSDQQTYSQVDNTKTVSNEKQLSSASTEISSNNKQPKSKIGKKIPLVMITIQNKQHHGTFDGTSDISQPGTFRTSAQSDSNPGKKTEYSPEIQDKISNYSNYQGPSTKVLEWKPVAKASYNAEQEQFGRVPSSAVASAQGFRKQSPTAGTNPSQIKSNSQASGSSSNTDHGHQQFRAHQQRNSHIFQTHTKSVPQQLSGAPGNNQQQFHGQGRTVAFNIPNTYASSEFVRNIENRDAAQTQINTNYGQQYVNAVKKIEPDTLPQVNVAENKSRVSNQHQQTLNKYEDGSQGSRTHNQHSTSTSTLNKYGRQLTPNYQYSEQVQSTIIPKKVQQQSVYTFKSEKKKVEANQQPNIQEYDTIHSSNHGGRFNQASNQVRTPNMGTEYQNSYSGPTQNQEQGIQQGKTNREQSQHNKDNVRLSQQPNIQEYDTIHSSNHGGRFNQASNQVRTPNMGTEYQNSYSGPTQNQEQGIQQGKTNREQSQHNKDNVRLSQLQRQQNFRNQNSAYSRNPTHTGDELRTSYLKKQSDFLLQNSQSPIRQDAQNAARNQQNQEFTSLPNYRTAAPPSNENIYGSNHWQATASNQKQGYGDFQNYQTQRNPRQQDFNNENNRQTFNYGQDLRSNDQRMSEDNSFINQRQPIYENTQRVINEGNQENQKRPFQGNYEYESQNYENPQSQTPATPSNYASNSNYDNFDGAYSSERQASESETKPQSDLRIENTGNAYQRQKLTPEALLLVLVSSEQEGKREQMMFNDNLYGESSQIMQFAAPDLRNMDVLNELREAVKNSQFRGESQESVAENVKDEQLVLV